VAAFATLVVTVPRAARAAAACGGVTFGAHAVPTATAHAAVRRTRRPTAILVVASYPVKAGCAGFGLAGLA